MRVWLVIVLSVAAVLGLSVPGSAAPPVLIAVGHQDRHPWAEWTLPLGVEATVVEVATAPDIGTDGYFFEEKRVAFEILESNQIRWLSGYQLDPGTYYVHVSGIDVP